MKDEEIFELAESNGFQDDFGRWNFTDEELLDFVLEVQKTEREKVVRWMIGQSYATGHGDTIEDLLKHLDWQARDYAHKLEREACAKVCDELAAKDKLSNYYAIAARAIRAKEKNT